MKALFRRALPPLAALLLLATSAPAQPVGDDAVLKRMDAVLEENARLREESWKARSKGKEEARRAADAYEASEARLEKTRGEALAHVAGVSPAQVDEMRREGKSWGQAAGELGVHPGFLGIGKVPMYEPASVRRAARAEAAKAKRKGAKGAKEIKDADSGKAKPGKKTKAGPGKQKSSEEPEKVKKTKKKKRQ